MLESRVSRVSDMKPSLGTGSNGQRSSNDADSNSRERLACSKVEFWRVLKLSDVFDVENASRVRRLCACKNPKKKHFWKAVALLWRHVKMEGKHRLGSRLSAPGDPWPPAVGSSFGCGPAEARVGPEAAGGLGWPRSCLSRCDFSGPRSGSARKSQH